jgi:hypothetical protein
LEAVRRSVVAAGECAETPTWPLPPESLPECLDGIETAERLLAAAKLHVIREIDAKGIPASIGARTPGWVADRLLITPAVARRLVRLAQAVDGSPGLDSALSGGLVNVDQVAAVVKAVDALPSDVGAEVRAKAEAVMLGWAHQSDARGLGFMGVRVLEHVAPEVAEAVEERRLRRDNASAFEARTLSLCAQGDGRVRVAGWLDTEMAAAVTAALDPLCSPRHRPAPDAGAGAGVGDPPGTGDPVVADQRTSGQRRADALVEVCRLALNTGELPENGGDRPQMTVTIKFDDLRDQVGAAILDSGERLTPAQARRLACDAHLLPAVLGSHGQVLDVGQSRRLITGALRRALVLRDGGCAFPGCGRPPRWTEGHHIRPWSDGGTTSLDNSVLLCGPHHRVIHHSTWTVRLGPDQRPEFIPPPHVDLEQRPRRNIYHHRT